MRYRLISISFFYEYNLTRIRIYAILLLDKTKGEWFKMDLQNKNHPELRAGEVWEANTSFSLKYLKDKTKRLGNVAYDTDGNIISGLRPIFILEEEKNGKF